MQRLVGRGISRLPRNSKSSLYEFNQIKICSEVRASDYSMLDVAEVIAVRNKRILAFRNQLPIFGEHQNIF